MKARLRGAGARGTARPLSPAEIPARPPGDSVAQARAPTTPGGRAPGGSVAPHRTARQAPGPAPARDGGLAVLAPRPDVVDALLGARAELAACAQDDEARADMWAVHAAMGGLLAAELAGARWPVLAAVVRLAWRCCAALVRWGVSAELETRRRRLAAGCGTP